LLFIAVHCCSLLFIAVHCCSLLLVAVSSAALGQGRMSAARGESWTLLEHVYDMRAINSNRSAHETPRHNMFRRMDNQTAGGNNSGVGIR
jgi:hypothetical protein